MESPWRQTFSLVLISFCVNNGFVKAQNLPFRAGQTVPQGSEYGTPGALPPQSVNSPFVSNSILYPDAGPPARFPDTIGSSGPVDAFALGSNPQQPSIPSISQLLCSLPSPNLIAPIPSGPLPAQPIHRIVPVPQFPQNPSLSSPVIPNIVLPPPYLLTSPELIPGSPFCSQHPGTPPFMQFIPSPISVPPQGLSTTPQSISNICPQEIPIPPPLPPYLFSGLPNLNIPFNPQATITPYQFTTPMVPGPQVPPAVPPVAHFNVNSVPTSQLQASPLLLQNFNEIEVNPSNFMPPFLQNDPSFVLQPQIYDGIFPQNQVLPPSLPPYVDFRFPPQHYPEPNVMPLCSTHPYSYIPDAGLIYPPLDMNLPVLQPMYPPPHMVPPAIFMPPSAPNIGFFPQEQIPSIPTQTIYLPNKNYPFVPNLGVPPQFQINALPPAIPPDYLKVPQENLPLNLQINLPATNIPPPYITIISTVPPNPPIAESDISYSLDNFIPYPSYSPPVVVKSSKSKRKKWIPILIALFASKGCGGGCCGSCSCGNNIPIPFPIAIPTNNPIVVNNKETSTNTKPLDDIDSTID